jgi:LysR family transcriptional regulator, glycine cleavage system transcriptional activator
MTRPLPPLNALRAFEAAARHLNMTRAAEELGVTPAAVSHQVVALEELLGGKLFLRKQRGLALTPLGEAYLPGLQEGFEKLREATACILDGEAGGRPLVLSVPPAFSAKWLMPRLQRVREILPDLQIVNDIADRPPAAPSPGREIAIRYGTGVHPGLTVEKLFDEAVFPVCSPALLKDGPPVEKLADLLRHTLLHGRKSFPGENYPSWQEWFTAAGYRPEAKLGGLAFDHHWMTVEAAIEAQGVALAKRTIIESELRRGRLVRLLDSSYPLGFAYYLVYAGEIAPNSAAAAFREWVLGEAAAMIEAF